MLTVSQLHVCNEDSTFITPRIPENAVLSSHARAVNLSSALVVSMPDVLFVLVSLLVPVVQRQLSLPDKTQTIKTIAFSTVNNSRQRLVD